jgi:hypothetical protein
VPRGRRQGPLDRGRRASPRRRRLHNQTERIRHYLGDDLRPGLSVAEAGERYSALASPELYQLVTVDFGWTADQHRAWLTQLMRTQLL